MVAEEDDPAFGAVLGGGDAAGDIEVFNGTAVFGADPAEDGVGGGFEAGDAFGQFWTAAGEEALLCLETF